jgi:hypothetical protein
MKAESVKASIRAWTLLPVSRVRVVADNAAVRETPSEDSGEEIRDGKQLTKSLSPSI